MRPDDLRGLLMKIRYDATAIQAKVTDALNALNELNLPEDAGDVRCPRCDLPAKGPLTLAEHLHISHGGPVPEHWTDEFLAAQGKKHRKPVNA